MYKRCVKCNKLKNAHLFGNDTRKLDGKKSYCKDCERIIKAQRYKIHKKEMDHKVNEYRKKNPDRVKSTMLKHWYGITLNHYNELLNKQNKKCAICRTTSPGRLLKYFHVDHDHKTNKVRGLLCSRCNQGIGYFKDNIVLLRNALEYLRNA